MTAQRLNILLAAGVLLTACVSLAAGKVWVPLHAWRGDDVRWLIIAELRAPRTVLAVVIGAGLGVSGAAMQGFLRNPLADPGLFGVSSGAALGAVLSLYFGFAASALVLPGFALAGAAITMALLAVLAGRSGSLVLFALAGIILSSVAGSMTLIEADCLLVTQTMPFGAIATGQCRRGREVGGKTHILLIPEGDNLQGEWQGDTSRLQACRHDNPGNDAQIAIKASTILHCIDMRADDEGRGIRV